MPPVTNHPLLELLKRSRINAHPPGGHRLALIRLTIGSEFDWMPALEQENLPRYRAHVFGQGSLTKQMPVLSVHGNKIFRPHKLQQDFHFLLARVSGHVD